MNIHGVTGFMSAMGDVEGMAKYAIELLSDDKMLAQFRANALAQARVFDIHRILPMYEAYYERILEQSLRTHSSHT